MSGELIKIGLSLAFVLTLILVGLRIFLGRVSSTQNHLIKTLGFLNLGPRKAIAVVKAGKEVILIGVTANDLKLIKAYPEDAFSTELEALKNNISKIKGLKEALRSEIK
ncbi:MAG: hypothetical protein D6710_08410 [Nitrospirae bacterium]|nr:MAG: hypothetical protein D6710_08410 [Nitrospirota bacterium]